MGLALDEPKANETPMKINGLDVLIGSEVKHFAEESVVDYVSSQWEEGFTIRSKYACSE